MVVVLLALVRSVVELARVREFDVAELCDLELEIGFFLAGVVAIRLL